MCYSRRRFLKHSANGIVIASVAAAVPRPLLANIRGRLEPLPPIEDPDIKQLTTASLESARSLGATYADARLTHTYAKRIGRPLTDDESMAFGVRALVDGYWGFAASPVWTVDEAARLGKSAVRNAKANALSKKGLVDLAPNNPVLHGHWTAPITEDPFEMSLDEIEDYLNSIAIFIRQLPHITMIQTNAEFVKQEKAFASTAGQYITQRLYRTSGFIAFGIAAYRKEGGTRLDCLTPASAGFEYFRAQPLRDVIRATYAETMEEMSLPVQPVEVGRYETVLDARSVANLVSGTIGTATELDRALGYEANATGTSYIADPAGMLGTLKIGAPGFSVTANRSAPLGAANTKWDDDGVVPETYDIVKDGVLHDMQTDREGAPALRNWYQTQQMSVASRGCSYAPDASYPQMTHGANLDVQPSGSSTTLATLLGDVKRGLLWKRIGPDVDYQQLTGVGMGSVFEIRNGKCVASVIGAGLSFRTLDFWKSATAMGGSGSVRRFGMPLSKGQPIRTSYHSVGAVPMSFKDTAVIDMMRRS